MNCFGKEMEGKTRFTWSPKPLPKAAACCTATTRAKYFTDESEHSAVRPAISSKASLLWLTNRCWSGGAARGGPHFAPALPAPACAIGVPCHQSGTQCRSCVPSGTATEQAHCCKALLSLRANPVLRPAVLHATACWQSA